MWLHGFHIVHMHAFDSYFDLVLHSQTFIGLTGERLWMTGVTMQGVNNRFIDAQRVYIAGAQFAEIAAAVAMEASMCAWGCKLLF